jgi:hypothetical protein
MSTSPDYRTLASLLNELLNGADPEAGFVLNPGDEGLLRSLDKLPASRASSLPRGGSASIAAHVDHVRYGLELLNHWARGENPFEDANYSASWRRTTVSDADWSRLRIELQREAELWLGALQHPERLSRDPAAALSDTEIRGIAASVVHLAYHLGAIRQIDAATRGPRAKD